MKILARIIELVRYILDLPSKKQSKERYDAETEKIRAETRAIDVDSVCRLKEAGFEIDESIEIVKDLATKNVDSPRLDSG